jgi:hypothetical protein
VRGPFNDVGKAGHDLSTEDKELPKDFYILYGILPEV